MIIKRTLFILAVLAMLVPTGSFASSGGGGGGSAVTEKSGFSYIEIETITVPIITDKGLSQQFSFAVSLEVDATKEGDVARFSPRLTDAYIQDLYGALGAGYGFMQSGVINVTKVKQRLREVTKTVLAPAHLEVNDVLLKVVQQYNF